MPGITPGTHRGTGKGCREKYLLPAPFVTILLRANYLWVAPKETQSLSTRACREERSICGQGERACSLPIRVKDGAPQWGRMPWLSSRWLDRVDPCLSVCKRPRARDSQSSQRFDILAPFEMDHNAICLFGFGDILRLVQHPCMTRRRPAGAQGLGSPRSIDSVRGVSRGTRAASGQQSVGLPLHEVKAKAVVPLLPLNLLRWH